MAGEPEAAADSFLGPCRCGRDHFAGHEPSFCGDLVDDRERFGDALGTVDHDRDRWDMAAELEELVAVGRVVSVEPPDAADGGRSGDVGGSESPDESAVKWLAVILGAL
jgi:hypothetical protein